MRVFLETSEKQILDSPGCAIGQLLPIRFTLEDCRNGFSDGLSFKSPLAGQQFIKHSSKTKDVRPLINRLTLPPKTSPS